MEEAEEDSRFLLVLMGTRRGPGAVAVRVDAACAKGGATCRVGAVRAGTCSWEAVVGMKHHPLVAAVL